MLVLSNFDNIQPRFVSRHGSTKHEDTSISILDDFETEHL